MILVITNALAPEHGREAQPLGNLRFGNKLIGTLRPANNEFADLELHQLKVLGSKICEDLAVKLTCNSVSVMVDRLTLA